MIVTENLVKTFDGKKIILNGINEKIEKNEKVVIIGPSGSGKSTFLRCLNLLETPTSGKIIFKGEDITAPKVDINKIRCSMGMVFQHFNLFPHFTILENISFAPIKLKLQQKEEALENANRLLKRIGLADKVKAYPSMISGGQKQRLAVATAILSDKNVLVFDEPTSGLDYHRMLEVSNMIRKLNDENKVIIIVSHDFEFLGRTCDKIFDMEGCSKERR